MELIIPSPFKSAALIFGIEVEISSTYLLSNDASIELITPSPFKSPNLIPGWLG